MHNLLIDFKEIVGIILLRPPFLRVVKQRLTSGSFSLQVAIH